MKRWGRRSLYLLGFIVWLIAMIFPVIAFLLATQGEIDFGGDQSYHLRLFLLQEPGSQGVGIEWTRPSRQPANCFQNTVSYLLWEGEGENTTYCLCHDPASGEVLSTIPRACKNQ
jgi:hypothetical protein